MFNGMIAPLLPMRLRMVWWYQGEANDLGKKVARGGPWWYRCLLPAMIQGWRAHFEAPTLPFYYVLLAAGHTAFLREAQVRGASALRNTAFASALSTDTRPSLSSPSLPSSTFLSSSSLP